MLERTEKSINIAGTEYVLKRPGMGGLERIMRRMAAWLASPNDDFRRFEVMFGRGIEGKALLSEYLTQGPESNKAKNQICQVTGKALVWDFEEMTPGVFLKLAEEAREFHAQFRVENDAFGLESRNGA